MKKILAIVLAVVMLLPVFAVNVFAEDLVAYDNPDGTTFKDCVNPWDFFGMGNLWGREAARILDSVSVDQLKAMLKEGGYNFTYVCGDKTGWSGTPKAVLNGDFENGVAFSVKSAGSDKYECTVKLDDVVAKWESLGKTIDEVTNFVVQCDLGNIKLYSAKFAKGEAESEAVVLVENKELKSWEVVLEGTAIDTLKSAMSKEGAVFEASYTTNGNKGWGYQLMFETNGITEGLTADGNKNTKTITSEAIAKQIGSVDNIGLFRSNYGVKNVTYNSIKVVKDNQVLVELGERAPKSWGEICTAEELTQIKKALSEEGTTLAVEYTTEGEGWGAQFIIETSGTTIGLEKDSTDKVLKMTAAEFAAACGGDVNYLARLRSNCDGGSGDTITYNYIKVTVPASGKKKSTGNLAFIYVTDEYHAVLIGGRFLAMPHTEILGYCPMCHAFIETEEAGDKSVFVLETTGGQDYDGNQVTVADGVVLVDAEGKGNARIATNWVAGGEAWNGIVKALPTEGAWLKITYTGKLNNIIFQTEKTSAPEAFETTAPAVVEEGEQNVAWFNCADIVANSPVALSGDFGGWANFMLNFEGDTTVYGFEIVVPEVVPTAE